MRVLVTGGTGYLGQFLLAALTRPPHSADTAVAYTYLSGTPPLGSDVQAFCADLASGRGVQEAVLSFAPHVVVNCAAVSQPGLCEQDHAAALAINCPQRLVDALAQLQQQAGRAALLVQLSTDQVYDGSRAWWSEGDPTQPVNAYGRSKLAAEQMLADIWQGRHVVLRSSLIYGSQAPLVPVQRPLFLQFIRQALEQQTPTAFFADEFRCAIYVQDIVAIITHIIGRCEQQQQQQQQQQQHPVAAAEPAPAAAAAAASGGCYLAGLPHSVYNMGGPQRLSRHDMAMAVAQHCGLDAAVVLAAKSADVKRPYVSPPDISMKVERLLHDMPGIALTPFDTALALIWPQDAQQQGS